jgi:hypothetical protein
VITQDSDVARYLAGLSEKQRKRVSVLRLKKEEVAQLIVREGIHYMFHSRPLNFYDGLTFPIKVFDALEWNLPVLTARHPPLVELFGDDYPGYVDVRDPQNIVRNIEGNRAIYLQLKMRLKLLSERNTYQQRVDLLLALLRNRRKAVG